jgi:ferric-dicitrate binding protein FerR (iron transport regulator)
MPSGGDSAPRAHADRIREENAKHARRLQRIIDEERAAGKFEAYREEMDSGEIDIAKLGVKAKGIPPKALGFAIAVLAVAAAVVAILRTLG